MNKYGQITWKLELEHSTSELCSGLSKFEGAAQVEDSLLPTFMSISPEGIQYDS